MTYSPAIFGMLWAWNAWLGCNRQGATLWICRGRGLGPFPQDQVPPLWDHLGYKSRRSHHSPHRLGARRWWSCSTEQRCQSHHPRQSTRPGFCHYPPSHRDSPTCDWVSADYQRTNQLSHWCSARCHDDLGFDHVTGGMRHFPLVLARIVHPGSTPDSRVPPK